MASLRGPVGRGTLARADAATVLPRAVAAVPVRPMRSSSTAIARVLLLAQDSIMDRVDLDALSEGEKQPEQEVT
jgi:hypothetical protein